MTVEPVARRPHMPGYGLLGPDQGSGLLPWDWAVERLTRSHDYWVATVWEDGKPHLTPVWGIWHDDCLWFSCSRRSRKARNLHGHPTMSASTDDPAEPVIIEGPAVPVEERDAVAAYALVADSKYGTNYGVAFYAAPENVCFRMTVLSAFGLSGDDFTGSPTRWTFDR